jgi:Ca2+-binding EF-hand superfamily protein
LDEDHSGFIDFREFVVGLSVLSKDFPLLSSLELAFKSFDKGKGSHCRSNFGDNKGYLNITELGNLLKKCLIAISEVEVKSLFSRMNSTGDGKLSLGNESITRYF